MPKKVQWRPLPLVASSDVPSLLGAIDIGSSAYTLHLTDLANIWTESLDRRAICVRGWDQNTSIDPSDTPENMATFLSCLKSALDPSHRDHQRTSVSLSPATGSDSAKDGLVLRITCDIPGLTPLRWPIFLRKDSPSSLTTSLVLPLIEAQYAKTVEVESLKQALSHKDSVLTKVLDKLEATGTGLDQVFNVLTGKKKVTRAAAEAKVKGLAPFQSDQWRPQLTEDLDSNINNARQLLQEVFGGSGLQYNHGVDIKEVSAALNTWWHHLKPASLTTLTNTQQHLAAGTTASGGPDDSINAGVDRGKQDDDDCGDEFQVQATPPRKKRDLIAREPLDGDVSTADEGGSPSPTAMKVSSSSNLDGKPSQSAARFGIVGGRTSNTKKSSTDRESTSATGAACEPPTKSPNDTSPLRGDTSETASEDDADQSNQEVDLDATASLADSAPCSSAKAMEQGNTASSPSPKAGTSKDLGNEGGSGTGVARRIGQIGGKHWSATRLPHNESEIDHDDDSGDDAKKKVPLGTDIGAKAPTDFGSGPPRRIGIVGGIGGDGTTRSEPSTHNAASGQDSKADYRGRGRSEASTRANQNTGPEKRETSQERVARKREEMKRELEKKAAAGPAKKKRRF